MSDPCPCGPFRVRVPVPAEPAVIRRVVPSGMGAPGRDGEPGPPGAGINAYPIAIVANGQTVLPYPLQHAPTLPSSVSVVVNGAAYRAPDILVAQAAVTWVNSDFHLDQSDEVFIVYT